MDEQQMISRRRWLRRAGGAAAGGAAVAVGGAVAAPPASAATGTMVYGTTMNADVSNTELDSVATITLKVANNVTGPSGQAIRAVRAGGSSGIAITGACTSTNSKGVYGFGQNGSVGVYGESLDGSGVGVVAGAGRVQFRMVPGGFAGAPAGSNDAGEFYLDENNILWRALTAGSPGTWVRPGFNPITPHRVFDSRNTTVIKAGDTNARTVSIRGTTNVPNLPAVSAVALNVTVLKASQAGYVAVYPKGPRPKPFSSVNFAAGQTIANFSVIGLSSSGEVQIYLSAGTANVALDVTGFYA